MDKLNKIRDWCNKNKGKTILIIIVLLVILGEVSKSPDSNQGKEQSNNTNTDISQPVAIVEKTQPSSAGSDAQAKEIQRLKDQIQQMKDQNSKQAETPSPVVNAAPSVIQTPIITQPQTPPKSWHAVSVFSGPGSKNTQSFSIRGTQWRLNWTIVPKLSPSDCSQYSCGMSVGVYKDDGTIADYFSPFVQQTSSDTSYEYNKIGNFYLKVVEGNTNSWEISVEDYY